MISRSAIENFAHCVAEAFKPQQIILFGSHAGGRPGGDSDVDLLVVMPFEGSPRQKATEIRLRVPANFPMDLLVRTPESLAHRLELGDPFFEEIVNKGEKLYESAHVGVD